MDDTASLIVDGSCGQRRVGGSVADIADQLQQQRNALMDSNRNGRRLAKSLQQATDSGNSGLTQVGGIATSATRLVGTPRCSTTHTHTFPTCPSCHFLPHLPPSFHLPCTTCLLLPFHWLSFLHFLLTSTFLPCPTHITSSAPFAWFRAGLFVLCASLQNRYHHLVASHLGNRWHR